MDTVPEAPHTASSLHRTPKYNNYNQPVLDSHSRALNQPPQIESSPDASSLTLRHSHTAVSPCTSPLTLLLADLWWCVAQVMHAFQEMIANPGSAQQYLADPLVRPVLLRVHSLLMARQRGAPPPPPSAPNADAAES
jgi:hypothetical protein